MNLYFLVEGVTELKVYPQWLGHLLPELSRVQFAQDAKANHYFLMSGLGYPRLLDEELVNSVADINEWGNYDYLVLVVDADDMAVQEKADEIHQFIKDNKVDLNPKCRLQIVAHKYCMETWFLGNRKVYTRTVGKDSDFYNHAGFYDVSQHDPQLMAKPATMNGSVSIYHEKYLRTMLAEKKIRYSKTDPRGVGEKHYLEQLQNRVKETAHLSSLSRFFNFCENLSL